ncbi:hypothetical protein [Streptomyces sp. NBC_01637]|uniref:hypothetical protein n=3 Tax=Streptomyces TaxID=1883 RepID=UPI00386A72A8|nr:hypothetical protein OH719_21310 [Streptomyces sp. NBC_01653]WTD35272.1 hypothetical protein OHB03_25310 [Streptomyces sp. NBC_01643]WTD90686.1 hypothetical protein OG891_25570 [Streptomyces sp. NBC_01637]
MSNGTAVVLGLCIGAGLVVLLPMGLVILLFILRTVNAPPEPDGPPLVLTRSRLRGTWQDDRGGQLVFAENGTFSATEACGDYRDAGTDASSGFDFPSTMTGTGTWDSQVSEYDDNATEVSVEFAPGDVSGELVARGKPDSALLWTFIGDPDSGELCVLRKVSTQP